jgi:signal transduction histidine kinase
MGGADQESRIGLGVPAAFAALWAAIPLAWCGAPEGRAAAIFVTASLIGASAAAFAAAAAERGKLRRALGIEGEEEALAAFPRKLVAIVTAVELGGGLALLALGSRRLGASAAEWLWAYGPVLAFSSIAFAVPRYTWARARAAAAAEDLGASDLGSRRTSRQPLGEALLKWWALVVGVTALPLAARTAGLFENGSAAAFAVDMQVLAAVGLAFGATAVATAAVRRRLAHRVAEIDAVPGAVPRTSVKELVRECGDMTAAIAEIGRRYAETCEAQVRLIETRGTTREKKAKVFASMSHDLRGPLNSVVGFSDLLLKGIDGRLSERQRATVAQISREAERLLGLIGDVLDTAKMEAGRFEVERMPVPCEEILEACREGAQRYTSAKGISLETRSEAGIPILFADRDRIVGALMGLLARTADATAEGGGLSLRVRRVSSLEEGRDYALFELLDEGGAVSPEWREHVLDVFASLEGVTIASEDGGLALGLSLVQRVLKLHGGELDVGSSGARAVFAAALPLDLEESEG